MWCVFLTTCSSATSQSNARRTESPCEERATHRTWGDAGVVTSTWPRRPYTESLTTHEHVRRRFNPRSSSQPHKACTQSSYSMSAIHNSGNCFDGGSGMQLITTSHTSSDVLAPVLQHHTHNERFATASRSYPCRRRHDEARGARQARLERLRASGCSKVSSTLGRLRTPGGQRCSPHRNDIPDGTHTRCNRRRSERPDGIAYTASAS